MDYELLEKQMYLLEINSKNRDLQNQHYNNLNNLDIITNATVAAAVAPSLPPLPQSLPQSQSVSFEFIDKTVERIRSQVNWKTRQKMSHYYRFTKT